VLPETPKQYTFEKVASYPHDTKAFTQGLEYHDGILYESTGAGNELISSIRKVDVKSGEILQKKEFVGKSDNGQDYFGEGITIVEDKIVFLMWLNNEGLLLNKSNFEQVGAFSYQNSNEGWGICNAGEFLIKSDGSNKLTFLNPKTFQEAHAITVYDSHGPVDAINELEFIEGKVYANIYGKDVIAIIDPQSGVVEGQINLVGLHSAPSQTDKELNGIAFNSATKNLYVTGKQWDKLYEIKVVAR
ncbi:MAG: glutaminyl-peptide cyclotransferase, partial [Sphingobacterium sp.]